MHMFGNKCVYYQHFSSEPKNNPIIHTSQSIQFDASRQYDNILPNVSQTQHIIK